VAREGFEPTPWKLCFFCLFPSEQYNFPNKGKKGKKGTKTSTHQPPFIFYGGQFTIILTAEPALQRAEKPRHNHQAQVVLILFDRCFVAR